MMIEDYCSFETSKLLKEKGFNEPCWCYWNFGQEEYPTLLRYRHCNSDDYLEEKPTAPTLQMAMKWLREVYGLHISLEPCYDYDSMHVVFLAFVQNVADVHEFMDGRKNVASHPNAEKSYEIAIKYCLENII